MCPTRACQVATSRICEKLCQSKCQYKCHNTCHKIHCMPNKMPKLMPEHMLEYLSHESCRSKCQTTCQSVCHIILMSAYMSEDMWRKMFWPMSEINVIIYTHRQCCRNVEIMMEMTQSIFQKTQFWNEMVQLEWLYATHVGMISPIHSPSLQWRRDVRSLQICLDCWLFK